MKTSKNINRVVSGVLATSMLTASCMQYQPIDEIVYGNVVSDDLDLGKLAIPISLKIKSEDVSYIKAIQRVVNDIFKSPEKAKAFNENPKSALEKYGYYGEVNLDDNLLRLTQVLSDKEIISAIQRNDLGLYLRLCRDKGFISSSKGIFADKFYQDQIDQIYQREDIKGIIKDLRDENMEAAILVAGLFVVALAAVAVAAWFAVGFATWAYVDVDYKVYGPDEFMVCDSRVMSIYTISSKENNSHIAVDHFLEEQVNTAITFLKDIKPDYFNSTSEIELRNLIKINIINQLNNIEQL